MPLLDYDYYGLSIWLCMCVYFVGKGLCGIVHRDLYIRAIRGGNTDRKGKSAMYFGLLFMIAFLPMSVLTLTTLIGLFGFFNIYLLSSLIFAIIVGWVSYQPREIRNKLKLAHIGYAVLGTITCFVVLYRINEVAGGADIWRREAIIKGEIVKNRISYITLFRQTFSQVDRCVEAKNQANWKEYCSLLATDLMEKLALQDRTNVYFIKLCGDDNICKLFKSGKYKRTIIKTLGEERVKKLLLGRQTSLSDNYRINETFSNTKYLFDLYSEAEIIVPITEDGKVIGAFVEVYGD